LPNLSIHRGRFQESHKWRPLVEPGLSAERFVEIMDTEEKKTDVNLAAWMLLDAHNCDFEQALLICNDADLALPVRMINDMFHLPMGVVNPNTSPRRKMPAELSSAATFVRQVRVRTLRHCLFQPVLTDSRGPITKPSSW
jgi:hypothetical protein